MKLRGKHCQCASCGRYFGSLSAFDKHRTGPFSHNVLSRECMTEEQMLSKGMYQDGNGWWRGSKWLRNADSTIALRSRCGDLSKPMGR